MAKMTIEQYQQKLKAKIQLIKETNKPLKMGADTGVSMLVERVFERGATSTNAPIGNYSSKPMYMNPKESPQSFAPKGKNGETRFKNGNRHKTRYFARGYREFRKTIGRQSHFVNLRLTNDLQSDVANSRTPLSEKSKNTIKKGRATKIATHIYALDLRPSNVKKIRGLEKKYGKKIFRHTKEEREAIIKTVDFELFKILNS